MKKVGMTLLRADWQSPLSPHFGLATWLLICDTETHQKTFERNRLLMEKGVVDVFVQHHCTDAVLSKIGPVALEVLCAAGIRAWYGPLDVPASQLIDRLKQGELEPANEARSYDHGRTSNPSRGWNLAGPCRRGGQSAKPTPPNPFGKRRLLTPSEIRSK
jgi:predicted Fe-Mo cluster-binding NifX family protein